jgi:hypothetical protein
MLAARPPPQVRLWLHSRLDVTCSRTGHSRNYERQQHLSDTRESHKITYVIASQMGSQPHYGCLLDTH